MDMKRMMDLRVTHAERVGAGCVWLRMVPVEGELPEIVPGQFAQLRVDAPTAFLRRPISIHDVDKAHREVSFLVQEVGEGTRWLGALREGDAVNAILPLGKGFRIQGLQPLLVGGGVGVAPLLYLGRVLREQGIRPTYLLGARTKGLLLRLDAFREVGDVYVTTEDGSMGERGFVTQHPIMMEVQKDGRNVKPPVFPSFNFIQTCGPDPMMKAVARYARERGIPCEMSLENRMACGVGACLCCVQATREGHKCVCTEGPVFDARMIVES